MGIIVTREGLAEKLTELSGNPSEHIRALQRPETKYVLLFRIKKVI